MKTLLFICGPNGIGKTTICKEIVDRLPNCAYVDSDPCRAMNPNILNDETIPTIAKNISDMITNYLNCPLVDTVIFSYGFHGRRKEVFRQIIGSLSHLEYKFMPYLLSCDEDENVRRMMCDNRDSQRISRAISTSRTAFSDVDYPSIDITKLSPCEAATKLIDLVKECQP